MAEKESKQTNSAEAHASRAADAINAKFSGPLAPLEKQLNGVLGEKAPYKIPKNGRETLVKLAPWLSLASGIFGLITALGIWRAAHRVNEWVDYANKLSASFGAPTQQVSKLGVSFWLAMIMLVVFSVLALLAFPGLKAKKKSGWNLMFFSSLASIAYAVVAIFYDGAGFSSFIGTALGTVLGLYLLFQVRSYYK